MEAFLLPGINAENVEHFNRAVEIVHVIGKKIDQVLSSTPGLKVLHVIGLYKLAISQRYNYEKLMSSFLCSQGIQQHVYSGFVWTLFTSL